MKFRKGTALIVCASAALLQSTVAFADPTVTLVQPLAFGKFVLRNNDTAATLTVSPLGVVTHDHAYIPITPAQNAVFSLTGFDPDVDLMINFSSPAVVSCSCGGPDYTVDSFQISPAEPHTDPGGNLTLNVGATLHTSGTHAMYSDAPFGGTLTMSIDY
jgi:hypothetical protein